MCGKILLTSPDIHLEGNFHQGIPLDPVTLTFYLDTLSDQLVSFGSSYGTIQTLNAKLISDHSLIHLDFMDI
jgi:hypothetical protein